MWPLEWRLLSSPLLWRCLIVKAGLKGTLARKGWGRENWAADVYVFSFICFAELLHLTWKCLPIRLLRGSQETWLPPVKVNTTVSCLIELSLNWINWCYKDYTMIYFFLFTQTDLPIKCNSPLVLDNETGLCRPPCSWTIQSPLRQRVYFNIIVAGLWMALIATVITFITWASIKNL